MKKLLLFALLFASPACAEKAPDAGKYCSDGSQCQSGSCVAMRAECNGEIIQHPKGNGYEQCDVTPGCAFRPIDGGCHLFFEGGKMISRCVN